MKYILLAILLISAPLYAVTALLTGERISGMTKICYYDYLGSDYVITIKATEICKSSIQVD